MNDQYLWDGTGPPDPEVEQLEQLLEPYRFAADQAEPATGPGRIRILPLLAALAAGTALLLTAGFLATVGRGPDSTHGADYRLEVLEGRGFARAALLPGDRLVLDQATRARIHIGEIGSVDLHPRSTLSVLDGSGRDDDGAYHLFLERGTLAASIFAAPRLFQVGTPSGIAVDMGCMYEATVEENGRTRLEVVAGSVSFETPARKVHVPSGAACIATPERGPGTPVWVDKADAYRQAVARLDDGLASPADLRTIIRETEARDTLTLWHLLGHSDPQFRLRILERIESLDGLTEDVDRQALLDGDPAAREILRQQFDWAW